MLLATALVAGVLYLITFASSIPAVFLAGTAAAGGIALINSIGNLAGFVAPYMIGCVTSRSRWYFVFATMPTISSRIASNVRWPAGRNGMPTNRCGRGCLPSCTICS